MSGVKTSSSAHIRIQVLAGTLGAEVSGVDLSTHLDHDTVAAIREAFHEHIVLVFPAQMITPAEQLAFTRLFGSVEPHPLASRKGVEGHPEVLVLENKKGTPGARNDFWHSDISFSETPPAASVLHGRTITPGYGDTMFCNMYQAYEELSQGMRKLADGLSAIHTSEPLVERNRGAASDALPIPDVPPPVEHPVVRTHPETGRRALYVNPYFTSHFKDMTVEESRPLLEHLHRRATRPENVYRHHWRQGDLLLWDNRCAMHYAVYDYDDTKPRLMHRTTAAGERPR